MSKEKTDSKSSSTEMNSGSNQSQANKSKRRDALKALGVGGLVAGSLPDKWTKPVVNSILLPAHAQTTCGAGSCNTAGMNVSILTAALSGGDLIVIGDKGKLLFHRKQNKTIVTPEDRLKEFQANTPKTIRRVKNEDAEWVEAIKGGPAALSNFSYSGPLTEMVVLGNLAIRSGEKVDWDGKNLKVTNNAKKAEQYIHREYRKGWSLGV